MSRPLRIEYPHAWHHVMNHSRRGQELFIGKDDYECFLDLLQETSGMFNIKIASYCLMPTHYHLLVHTPETNLSRCMRHLNGVFTQRYNIRHECDGTLFRGRYKSILVEQDRYLLQLVRYIHRNPLRAGIVEKLDQFQWSSHKGYVSKSKKWDWLYKGFILSMVTSNKSRQIKQYKQFVCIAESEEISQMFKEKNVPPILGSENFIKVKRTFFSKKRDKEIPESKTLAPDHESIIEKVISFYKISKEQLYATKRGTENEPRNAAIYLMRTLRGETLIKIGSKFNLTRYSSVSSVIDRVGKRLNTDKKFKKRIGKITEVIVKSHE